MVRRCPSLVLRPGRDPVLTFVLVVTDPRCPVRTLRPQGPLTPWRGVVGAHVHCLAAMDAGPDSRVDAYG